MLAVSFRVRRCVIGDGMRQLKLHETGVAAIK